MLLRPHFSSAHDEIKRRVFNVDVVRYRVRMMMCNAALEFGVGRGSQRIGAQEVAKEESIALIGAAANAHVQVDVWFNFTAAPPEVGFGPLLCVLQRAARRDVIFIVFRHIFKPKRSQLVGQLVNTVERFNAQLDVDEILGGKSRHRSRSDVINAHCKRAGTCLDFLRQAAVLLRPLRSIVDNYNLVRHLTFPLLLQNTILFICIAFVQLPLLTKGGCGCTQYTNKYEVEMAGTVGYFDIGAKDKDKMSAFYQAVFDWKATPYGPNSNQMDTQTGEGINGAITALGHEPHNYVMIYMTVDSIEESLEKISANGGSTVIGPIDIPGGSARFAWFKDPEGNLLGLWQQSQN